MFDEKMDRVEGHECAADGEHGVDAPEGETEGSGGLAEGGREAHEMSATGNQDPEREHENTSVDHKLEDLPGPAREHRR